MNVIPYNTTDYKNNSNWTLGENKPKQTQFQASTPKQWQGKRGARNMFQYSGTGNDVENNQTAKVAFPNIFRNISIFSEFFLT
jgi:hypothetical protein